jgi:hypothetical protein
VFVAVTHQPQILNLILNLSTKNIVMCLLAINQFDVVCTVHHPTICIWRCMHRASSYNIYIRTVHHPTICIWRCMHRASFYNMYMTLYALCIILQYVYDVVCTVHHPTICIWRCVYRASSYNMYMTLYAPCIILQYVYDVVCTVHHIAMCKWPTRCTILIINFIPQFFIVCSTCFERI